MSRLKRRSSVGPRQGPAPPPPPMLQEKSLSMDTDDSLLSGGEEEVERKRRHERGANKRHSLAHHHVAAMQQGAATPQGTPVAGSASSGGVGGFSAAQLAEHYTNCMKLSAENKISIKNAFQLKLIDTMSEMIRKKAKDMDNFQSASCALDASTKIYAYRVDNVHHETLKLANGVGSTKPEPDNAAAAVDDDGNPIPGAQTKKVRKKRRANTVEKNLANINMPKFDLEFDTDPLFKKISAQFDSGGGGGQFLHTLPMRDDGCQLLLDSTALMGSVGDVVPKAEGALDGVLDTVALPKLEKDAQICPEFASFTFRNWSLQDDDELNESLTALEERQRRDEQMQLENDEHAFDPNDLPPPEFGDDAGGGGGDFGVDFDAGAAADNDDAPQRNKPRVPISLLDVAHLREHLAAVPSEYSYFDSGRLGAWAGPHHWKFKAPPVRRTGAAEERAKAKKKKESEKLCLDDLFDSEKKTLATAEKALTVPKKAIKLQNKTIESWTDEKNLLPEDLHYSGADFVKLDDMSQLNLAPSKRSTTALDDDDVEDYNFDNLNDSQNFCPDVDTNVDDVDGGGGEGFTTTGFSQTLGDDLAPADADADQLVAAPNRVEKIQIGYAKQAKKVDMRRLKRVEWSILRERSLINQTLANKENEGANESASTEQQDESSNETPPTLTADTKFSEMYSSLKMSRELPTKMVEGLSVPLAFVALLHLCNEETLGLGNSLRFDDLTIGKA